MSRLLHFVGDPHGDFASILSLAGQRVGDIVIVGGLELPAPIHAVLAPLFATGWGIHYVLGNHDSDICQQLDWLTGDRGGHPAGDLHARVADLGGVRVAGLGGVFKGRVWLPDEEVRYASREDWMGRNRERWRGGLPVHLRDTIFPEDFLRLGSQRADILVCHEGPSSVWRGQGWLAIDDLANRMGARLVVHGHHHHSGSASLPNGVGVRSLGIAETWELPR